MNITLHALQDDYTLHAEADTLRSTGLIITSYANLTDPSGNKLKDTAGNFLVGPYLETVYPQILHALQDDFTLHSE